MEKPMNKNIFVVHGHDKEFRQDVQIYLFEQGWRPIVLADDPIGGNTIIEGIEKYADVHLALILYTACDLGRGKNETELKPRARQNVVLEHGFFIGCLGRDRTIVIYEDGVERPSDIDGVRYIAKDNEWQSTLRRELDSAAIRAAKSEEEKKRACSFPKLPLEVKKEEKLEAYRADLIPLVKAVSDRESADLASLRLDTGFEDKVIKFLVSVAAELELVKKAYDSDYCCSITDKGEEFLYKEGASKLPSQTPEQEA